MVSKVALALTVISVVMSGIPFLVQAQSVEDQKAQLEAQLKEVQAEEAQANKDLVTAKSHSNTLRGNINALTSKIKKLQLDINAKNLTIKKLAGEISDKQKQLNVLGNKISQDKQEMSEVMREIDNSDDSNLPEIILANTSWSQAIADLNRLADLNLRLAGIYSNTKQTEASTALAKNALTQKQNATTDAKYAVEQNQKTVKSDQGTQQKLLSISKNNEKAFSSIVAQKKAQIDAINAKLFALAGGGAPINFGQAYKYAQEASAKTGVDPAFLLAILTQESNLGKNQGTCYLSDSSTGAGQSVKTGKAIAKVMSPTRDVPPFLSITQTLGLNPYHTIVSCPQSVGWGGAMGPAQFIASTWKLLSSRISKAVGTAGTANPWNPEHAFMASALYLADLGAGAGGYTAESNAACRYYSGQACSASSLIKSYGTSVMSLASSIQQTEINPIKGI